MPATQQMSTQAMACTHCREKKLRCGRERPRCANCKRDGVECAYSTPGKRVNHIKLLCDSVSSVIDRLGNVEGELSRLNIMLKTGSNQNDLAEEGSVRSPADEQQIDDTPLRNNADRHAVRSQDDLVDRYHGPCSLLALCNDLRDSVLLNHRNTDAPLRDMESENTQTKQDMTKNDGTVEFVLSSLCLEASLEESFDLQSDHVPIRLPPKQFLLMVQTQFFQRVDYTTDLFVQASFWSNVEQIYSRPYRPSDEAWAICFNTIILLVLSSETCNQRDIDPVIGSQFALPFLMTVRTALSNPRVLMAPKLINVQALALLCIAGQQYYPTGLSESIFAQACMLSRTMGLHQTHIIPEGISPEEQEERHKVFMSLYLRDKSFSIARGSLCWLPSFDCNLPSNPAQIAFSDPNCVTRIALARLQEDIYQSFYSAQSQIQSPNRKKTALSRIETRLNQWAKTTGIFCLPFANNRNFDLRLDFLAANISACRTSRITKYVRKALDSARASCMILLLAYGKHDQSTLERLESILPSDAPSTSFAKSVSSRSDGFQDDHLPDDTVQKGIESSNLRSFNLLDSFSIPGVFGLVKSIINADSNDAASEADSEEDLELLQKVYACFQDLEGKVQQSHSTIKIVRVLQGLLEIVSLTRKSIVSPVSLPKSNGQSSTVQTTPNSQDYADRVTGVSDFSSLLTSSSSPLPSLTWPTPTTTQATTRMGVAPNLVLPLDTQFSTSAFDLLRQPFAPTTIQHPNLPAKGRKRLHESDGDVRMDHDPDLISLSDFLFVAPDGAFDIVS